MSEDRGWALGIINIGAEPTARRVFVHYAYCD